MLLDKIIRQYAAACDRWSTLRRGQKKTVILLVPIAHLLIIISAFSGVYLNTLAWAMFFESPAMPINTLSTPLLMLPFISSAVTLLTIGSLELGHRYNTK